MCIINTSSGMRACSHACNFAALIGGLRHTLRPRSHAPPPDARAPPGAQVDFLCIGGEGRNSKGRTGKRSGQAQKKRD